MNDNHTSRYIGAFLVLCLILGIFITVSQVNRQPLASYVDERSTIITTVAPYQPEPELHDMQTITDSSVGLTVNIPVGWTRVIKDGWNTYIDPDTSAYIQIRKGGYSPSLNNISENSVRVDLSGSGSQFVEFSKDRNDGYTLLYQQYIDDILYDYIEITRIDLQTYARVVICTPNDVYNQLLPKLSGVVDSVVWDPAHPIPDDFSLVYNPFGNFEFAVPVGWDRKIENGDYVARDLSTSAEMHVTVYESSSSYENINQAIFAEYMSSGKEGFSIRQFTSARNLIYCLSSYSLNDCPVYRVDYMLATGVFEYCISFLCPTEYYQEVSGTFEKAFSLFRTF